MKPPKKSILIFVDAFTPPAYLPRVRYFCNYLAQKDWDINIIFENTNCQLDLHKNINKFTVDYYKYKKGILNKVEWGIKFGLNLLVDYKSYFFIKKSKEIIYQKRYDVIFSSTCSTFPITAASKIAQKLNVPLFIDLRDIAEQSPDDEYYLAKQPPKFIGKFITNYYKKINLNRRNRALAKAEAITTVSEWHVKIISQYNSNTHLIYNGFDEDSFFPKNKETRRFVISYFGRLYSKKMRDPSLIFYALESLKRKNTVFIDEFVVKWFVDEPSKNVLQSIAKSFNLEDKIEILDFIKPNELPDEMHKSSILLIISVDKTYFGIMTTKLFESIGVNKPILCFPDNEDELSEFIKKNECGVITSDVQEIEDFLLEKYKIWKKQGFVDEKFSDEKRLKFSRKNGAEILENLFIKTVKQLK